LKTKVQLFDAENLDKGPIEFSPIPGIDPERGSDRPPPVSHFDIPDEPKRILLFDKHYYPLHPKNSFPNLPKDSKQVVKLESPFAKALDINSAPTDPVKAALEPSDVPITSSRSLDAPLTDATTQYSKGMSSPATGKSIPDGQLSLPAPGKQTDVPAKPLATLGNALVGFLAGAGLITTAYGVFLGGRFLFQKIFGRKSRTERRRHKKRVINYMPEE